MISSVTNKSHMCEHAHRYTNKYKEVIGPGHLGIKHDAGYSNKIFIRILGLCGGDEKVTLVKFWEITEPFI